MYKDHARQHAVLGARQRTEGIRQPLMRRTCSELLSSLKPRFSQLSKSAPSTIFSPSPQLPTWHACQRRTVQPVFLAHQTGSAGSRWGDGARGGGKCCPMAQTSMVFTDHRSAILSFSNPAAVPSLTAGASRRRPVENRPMLILARTMTSSSLMPWAGSRPWSASAPITPSA